MWQSARLLVKSVYEYVRKGAFGREFELRDQVKRAALSVMTNLAEGFERGSNKDFVRFLFIAKASCGEVRSLIYVAEDQDFMKEDTAKTLRQQCFELSSQIGGFIKYLEKN